MTAFNSDYLEPLVNMYFYLSKVTTPPNTLATSTFSIALYNANGAIIEEATAGVYFTATPGSLTDVSITPSNDYIRQTNVEYQFTFKP